MISHLIGARVKRREDPELVTGRARYVADIDLPDMAHLAVVRSPYAHAKVVSIDTSSAAAMPGIIAVLTAQDIVPHLAETLTVELGDSYSVKRIPVRQPLATDRVRYIGDPVAVVIADDPYLAADAAQAVLVNYDPLPVIVDAEAALADGAPVIHEQWEDNVAYQREVGSGDVEEAFARAEKVIEVRIVNQRLIPNAIEPRAATAVYDAATESFTVWTTTQAPHGARDDLAKVLGIPEDKIRVIAPEVGGGFGAKGNVYYEEVIAAFMARKLGRPVHWKATRSEDYVATVHGRDQVDYVRLAADRDGHVQALDLKVIANSGAYYSGVTPYIPPLTGMMMTGVYQIPVARAVITGVFTNKVPTEPYRGAGRPEAAFLIERAMDVLADELGIDPAEIRRRNYIPVESFPYTTPTDLKYDSGNYIESLEKALALVDYKALRKEQEQQRNEGGNLLGIGIATYVEICGFGPWEAATVSVADDGKVTVLTGTSPHGQGHETTWSQIVAQSLQIPLEDITVKHGDTAVVPRGIGTFGSRSAAVGGSAVHQNVEKIRERATQIAAHLLEAAPEDIILTDGQFHVKGFPSRAISLGEIASAANDGSLPEDLHGELRSDEDFTTDEATFPFGTHVCVVEINRETGQVQIVRYVSVDDCGRVINPLIVEGQIHGGAAQGIGQALYEGAVYDEGGNLLTGSLMDYALPKADTMPAFESHRMETPSPLNPLGVKGIGESATVGSTPTVANAVIDALSHLGVRHLDMPFTPERIWRVLQAKS